MRYSKQAEKQLAKLDKHTARLLYAWIGKNLHNCPNPFAKGKPLSGERKGTWRYRVGDYRIIVEVHDNELIILVLAVGNRRDVCL